MAGMTPERLDILNPQGDQDMARRRGQRTGWLRAHRGTWLLTYRDYSRSGDPRETVTIGPAEGPEKLTKKQAQRDAWRCYLAPLDNSVLTPWSAVTLSKFWELNYRSHLERKKKFATQSQYRSLWKLWIEPALGATRLFELKPQAVDLAIAHALNSGKGSATARHIRKVTSAMLEHARKLGMFTGENPAQLVEVQNGPPVRRKRALTSEQCRQWFSLAQDQPANLNDARSAARPIRTMSLLAVCCSLGVSEQLGLRWSHVNLTEEAVMIDGELLEPRTVAIREHSYHGHLGTLKHGHRRRDVPLPGVLVEQLKELQKFAGVGVDGDTHPKGFDGQPARCVSGYDGAAAQRGSEPARQHQISEAPVFPGLDGKPLWADTLLAKTMKPLARTIGLEWISWNAFRHTCATLSKSLGMMDVDRRVMMGHAEQTMTDRYTHEDWERMRAGIEKIAADVTAAPKKQARSDFRLTGSTRLARGNR